MKTLKGSLLALCLMLPGITEAGATVAGTYLVTFHDRHPTDAFQEPLCVKIVQDGSTLDFKTGGTFVLDFGSNDRPVGQWFTADTRGAVFTAFFTGQYGPSVLVFSGQFGRPQITGTSFALYANGVAMAGGSFTAVKGACSF